MEENKITFGAFNFTKTMQLLPALLLMLFVYSCGLKDAARDTYPGNAPGNPALERNAITDTIEAGAVTKVVCEFDSLQSYVAYIPSKPNHEALPVVYFFDPHGNGLLPINKYKALGDKYNLILIGSNNSKNGNDLATTEHVWNLLFDDTQHRIRIDSNRVYVCGFSGGAKVATYIALQHNNIQGVIANGAGSPGITTAGNFNFSFTAIAGEGDMNMTDLVAITNELDRTHTRHRIIFFDGIHEWAPVETMDMAFAGLQLDAMYAKQIPVDSLFINAFIERNKKQVEVFLKANNFLKAETVCKMAISMLDGLNSTNRWFKQKQAEITASPVYTKQWQARQNILATEEGLKEVYQQQFRQGDENYWRKTIRDIDSKSKANGPTGDMYKRLKAYLSLAFYSISNQLINSNQNDAAKYFVGLYQLADPSNSEAWYFSAILDARRGNATAAQNDLFLAVAKGFTDTGRLLQQPEFKSLGAQLDLGAVERRMK